MDRGEYVKARLRARGQVTLPPEVREFLNVEDGDDLVFRIDENGKVVVDRVQIIPPDQAWFWTERWQQLEQQAQADIDAGHVRRYATVDEALADLERDEDAGDRNP